MDRPFTLNSNGLPILCHIIANSERDYRCSADSEVLCGRELIPGLICAAN